MADAYEYVASTGVIVPDTADVQAEIQAEWKTTFGSGLSVDPSTPQGIIITADTLARTSVLRNNAALANQINPNIAGGIFLDALCALTGLARQAETRSTISGVTLTGVAGTIVPAGVTAKTSAGDVFESITQVTIPSGGTVTVDFQSVEYGPIPALAGTLTQIDNGVLGWETVTNPNAAVLGTAQESDASLRARRRQTLALQGIAIPEAITSALYDVEGVRSLTFRENVASTTQTIDGVTMLAHSIWACVDGGTDADIAAALLQNKSAGCAWTSGAGTPVTVNVTDVASGQTYAVAFDRPTEVGILVKATVKAGSYTGNVTDAVKAAIMAYVNNDIADKTGIVVGQSVSPFELAGAVNENAPGIFVQKMEVSLASSVSWQTTEIALNLWKIASIEESYITVVVV